MPAPGGKTKNARQGIETLRDMCPPIRDVKDVEKQRMPVRALKPSTSPTMLVTQLVHRVEKQRMPVGALKPW